MGRLGLAIDEPLRRVAHLVGERLRHTLMRVEDFGGELDARLPLRWQQLEHPRLADQGAAPGTLEQLWVPLQRHRCRTERRQPVVEDLVIEAREELLRELPELSALPLIFRTASRRGAQLRDARLREGAHIGYPRLAVEFPAPRGASIASLIMRDVAL